MISPIGTNLLVQLDVEQRRVGEIHLPDEDSIRYCKRCHNMMEALTDNPRCVGIEVYENDDYHDRPVYRGLDHSHDYASVTAPVIEAEARIGTVLLVGPKVREVHEGDRVAVASSAGGSADDLRLVREEVVLAAVEDDDTPTRS